MSSKDSTGPRWVKDPEQIEILKEIWSFFDAIYCINLNTRPDRKESSQVIFDRYQIPITFHNVDRHPVSGLQGCFESHIDIITEGYNKNYQNIMIFEDDLLDSPNFTSEFLALAVGFMESDKEWELFYLGTHLNIYSNRVKFVSPHILKVKSFTTHAYAVSRRGMERYQGVQYKDIPYDFLTVENDQAYAIYPGLFYQDGSDSDINMTDFPLMGWIKRNWYYIAEMYAYHINVPFMYLGMFALMIATVVMTAWYTKTRDPGLILGFGTLIALMILFILQ